MWAAFSQRSKIYSWCVCDGLVKVVTTKFTLLIFECWYPFHWINCSITHGFNCLEQYFEFSDNYVLHCTGYLIFERSVLKVAHKANIHKVLVVVLLFSFKRTHSLQEIRKIRNIPLDYVFLSSLWSITPEKLCKPAPNGLWSHCLLHFVAQFFTHAHCHGAYIIIIIIIFVLF